jgi:hypothetical protein
MGEAAVNDRGLHEQHGQLGRIDLQGVGGERRQVGLVRRSAR